MNLRNKIIWEVAVTKYLYIVFDIVKKRWRLLGVT